MFYLPSTSLQPPSSTADRTVLSILLFCLQLLIPRFMLELFSLLDDLDSVLNNPAYSTTPRSVKPSNNRQDLAYSKWKREQEPRVAPVRSSKRIKHPTSSTEVAARRKQCLAGYCCKHNASFDSKFKCWPPCQHQCYWNPTELTDWHLCHTHIQKSGQLTLRPEAISCVCDKNQTLVLKCERCHPEPT